MTETMLEAPSAPAEEALAHPILEKYGGDVGKALDALAHAQQKIGRQANELGALRKANDALLVEVE